MTSAIVPDGPPEGMSAAPPDVVRATSAPAFGSLFMEATSAGVEALGMNAFAAASALVEKGQNALAWFGKKAAAREIVASPDRKK